MTRSLVPSFVRAAFFGLTVAFAIPVFAEYQSQSIRLVVPFPAGGLADVLARAIAQPLSQALGQPVLVENKPGADGLIAGELVARAAPDGHTLLFGGTSGMNYAPIVHLKPPYDPVTSFSPIGIICDTAFYLYVPEALPARSVSQLIALARAQPGAMSYGSATAFSIVASLQFAQGANLQMVSVPYKGEPLMLPDLVAGRLQFSIASGGALALVKSGGLRVLATSLPGRVLPNVPTFSEAGIRSVQVISWSGLFGPAGMPPEVVERLSRELRAVLSQPELRERFELLGLRMRPSTPVELSAFVKEQHGYWRQGLDAAGIKAQ